MPFRSEKQRRYLWKNHPKIARDWTDTYGSKPQPKKKAKGGGIDKYHRGRLSPEDIKRSEKATEGFKKISDKLKKEKRLPTDSEMDQMLNEITGRKSPSYLKGKEKAKEHQEKLKKLLRKGTGYVEGWLGKQKGGITSAPFLRGRSGSGNIKAWRGEGGWKQAQKLKKKLTLTDKLRMQDKGTINKKTGRLHPEHERALKGLSKKELKQMIKTGRNPRLPESKSTFGTTARGRRRNLQTSRKEAKYIRDRGFKKGGRVKKNGPVRPIDIPWDSQKKKKGGTVHPRNTGVAVPQKGLGSLIPKLAQQAYGKPKEKKYHFKKGGIMEPYRGSYISGTVDGKMLSNPSLRKYYKGLI